MILKKLLFVIPFFTSFALSEGVTEMIEYDIGGGQFVQFVDDKLEEIRSLECGVLVEEFRNSEDWRGAVILTLTNPASKSSWQLSYSREGQYDWFTTAYIVDQEYVYRNVLGKLMASDERISIGFRENQFGYHELRASGARDQSVSVTVPEELSPNSEVSVTLSGVKGEFLCWGPAS